MILTDGVHLISGTSIKELHEFAKGIGLKRAWFQDKEDKPHYDLTSQAIVGKALDAKAQLVDSRVLRARMVRANE